MSEIYRRNAGIVVFNRQRQVLLCKRNDVADSWQFPQGGIEEGETVAQAARRELYEETSLKNVTLIKSLEMPARYTFPPNIIELMQKRGFHNIGQDIYWSLFFFDGNDAEIDLQTENPEFSEYRWGTLEEACSLIIPFKKTAYEAAHSAFGDLIAHYKLPAENIS